MLPRIQAEAKLDARLAPPLVRGFFRAHQRAGFPRNALLLLTADVRQRGYLRKFGDALPSEHCLISIYLYDALLIRSRSVIVP